MARKHEEPVEKILDVDASMQGTITFKDPVNLRINGTFDGRLDTRGVLTIGETARVKANITGDKIIVAGQVIGDIAAYSGLTLASRAIVRGNIQTPMLSVLEGAIMDGQVRMTTAEAEAESDEMNVSDVAHYLELEESVVEEWASQKKIPAEYQDGSWKFQRSELDRWIQEERINS